ncbi:MAG: hypothetical protein DVB22_001130 [Verrucomicrobia bacterium]|nr:MAG: hypothetical protein DVB22_001130 [Verrucomicrobiota bacterium]
MSAEPPDDGALRWQEQEPCKVTFGHPKSLWTTGASRFSNTPEDPGRVAGKPPPK